MDYYQISPNISSPAFSSPTGSFISEEDRIDSDIEADILQANIDENTTVRTCSPASLQSSKHLGTSQVFIRKAMLSSVSCQLKNASVKSHVGDPSCVSFRKYVAIGTNKGVIFIFNLHQVLRLCFGNISPPNTPEAKAGEAQGPITVLSQNPNGTLLMTAYSSGRIAVWQIPASVLSEKSGQDTIMGRQYAPDDESDIPETSQRNDGGLNSIQLNCNYAPQEVSLTPKKRGSVSFSNNGGYGRLLCIVDDAHGVGHSIGLCCFTTVSSLAACVDTGGSTIDISNIHLRLNSDLFKFPKISEALAVAGVRACMHSITAYGSQLLILGETGLYLIALRTWNESVIFLLRRKQLQLGLNYMEAALKSITSVNQTNVSYFSNETVDNDYSESLLYNQILTILHDEVLHVLSSQNDENDNWISASSVIESIFRIACMIKKPEFIWLELYPAVRNLPQLASALFNAIFSILKSLPPFEQLRTNCSQPLHEINSKQAFIQLPPDMSKELIDWCLHEDDALEANIDDMNSTCSYNLIDRKVRTEICLLRLHPSCLDLNYILQRLSYAVTSDEFFAKGQLGQSRCQQLYYCLILTSLSPSSSSPIFNKDSQSDSVYQTKELEESNCQLFAYDVSIPCRVFIFIISQFSMVHSKKVEIDHNLIYQLFKGICDSNDQLCRSLLSEFELAVIESIESGLLKHLEQCATLSSEKGLYKVCEYIHQTSGNKLLVLKYQILLLKRIILAKVSNNSTYTSIHSDHNAVKLASCIFQCLEHNINRINKKFLVDDENYDNLKLICFEQAEVLADWDEERTLKVLYGLTNASISEMLELVNSYVKEKTSNQHTTYLILRAFFKCRKVIYNHHQTTNSEECTPDDSDDETTSTTKNWKQFLQNYDTKITELFIYLLVNFELPSSGELLTFLESYNDYAIEHVLKVLSVEKYPIEVAYLYEKSGDLSKATELYEQIFSETWQKLIKEECKLRKTSVDFTSVSLHNSGDQSATIINSVLQKLYDNVHQANQRLVNFCQRRCAQTNDQSEIEGIWFSVIDLLMKCEFVQNHPVLNAQLSNIFYNSFSLVMTYLPPTVIVSHILDINGTEITVNSKINLLVKKFISACQFEANQMVINKQLAGKELTSKQLRTFKEYNCGFSNRSLICSTCGLDLRINNLLTRREWEAKRMMSNDDKALSAKRVIVFHCHHAFHERCLREFQCKTDTPASVVHFWSCSICRPVSYPAVKTNCFYDDMVKLHSDEIKVDNPTQSSTKNEENILF
uniref:Vacuolar protein sorting-associated protein 8-like protein n=1 Tax=Schistosoma haematobium TaxID=6185 RepID=A0A095A0D4_SCHHA